MNIEKLFKKAEKFFVLDSGEQGKKEKKKEKLSNSLQKKIASLKKKIKIAKDAGEKNKLKKQLDVLKGFFKKIK